MDLPWFRGQTLTQSRGRRKETALRPRSSSFQVEGCGRRVRGVSPMNHLA